VERGEVGVDVEVEEEGEEREGVLMLDDREKEWTNLHTANINTKSLIITENRWNRIV
jgi:hypothetical protein